MVNDPAPLFCACVVGGAERVEWGGTGSSTVGAEASNTYMLSSISAKDLGDLPYTLSWIRPVAITGQIGYAISARNFTTTFGIDPDTDAQTIDTELNPARVNGCISIQYSMPYETIRGRFGLPDFINHLISLVEANLQTLVANVDVGKGDHRHHLYTPSSTSRR